MSVRSVGEGLSVRSVSSSAHEDVDLQKGGRLVWDQVLQCLEKTCKLSPGRD